MILSDKTIEKLLAEGSLAIEPLEPEQIQPASVDIRLGDTFGIVEDTPSGIVGLEDEIAYKTIRTDRYILLPGQFVLATTMEYVRLGADLTAFVEGRSSLGRMGLFVQNAGWVDPGFEGEITLELQVEEGVCRDAAVYTDSMDAEFAAPLAEALRGCRFRVADLCGRVREVAACCQIADDLCALLGEQEI